MKTRNRLWLVSWFLTVAFFMSAAFGCASTKDFKRMDDCVQRSEAAAEASAQSADEAKEAAKSAAQSADEANAAADRAEDMANKSEAIFKKLMKK